MNKQELLDIIFDLSSKQRELLAAEIYQSLDAAKDDLNAAWIVEANRRMLQIEDTPPALPEEYYSEDDNYDGGDESTQVPDYQMIEDIWDYIDRLRVHLTLDVRLRHPEEEEFIPGEQVMRELKDRMAAREQLLGGLEPTTEPVPNVTAVCGLDDFKLQLTFEDGQQRIFDMEPYTHGIFSQLSDPEYFSWVRVHWGGIQWLEGESMGARRLYRNSKHIKEQ